MATHYVVVEVSDAENVLEALTWVSLQINGSTPGDDNAYKVEDLNDFLFRKAKAKEAREQQLKTIRRASRRSIPK